MMDTAAEEAREAIDRGLAAMDAGRYEEAVAAFEAAVARRPSPRAFNNAGIALMALERREEAARAFESALKLDARYALASYNLARLAVSNDPEAAFAHLQSSVQAGPSNADAWLLLADLLRRRKDYANAMRAMNLAIERAPQRATAWTARASLLAEIDQEETARNEFAAAWGRFPSDLRSALGACLTLPHVYASHAQLEESRAAYAAGLQRLHEDGDRFAFGRADGRVMQSRWQPTRSGTSPAVRSQPSPGRSSPTISTCSCTPRWACTPTSSRSPRCVLRLCNAWRGVIRPPAARRRWTGICRARRWSRSRRRIPTPSASRSSRGWARAMTARSSRASPRAPNSDCRTIARSTSCRSRCSRCIPTTTRSSRASSQRIRAASR